MSEINFERKSHSLSAIERWFFNIAQVIPFNIGVIATTRTIIPLEILREAIVQIKSKHYYLNVRLTSEDHDMKFVLDTDSEPEIIYKDKTFEREEQEESLKNIHIPFALNKSPLFRITVLNDNSSLHSSILLTISHIIADGTFVFNFLKDILYYSKALLKKRTFEAPKKLPCLFPDQKFFPPRVEKSIPQTSNRNGLVQDEYFDHDKRCTEFIDLKIGTEKTSKIIQLAKENDTSVHGIICASSLIALSDLIFNTEKMSEPVAIDCISPINMRGLCNPTVANEQAGNWISYGTKTYEMYKENNFWELAVQTKKDLNQIIDERRWAEYATQEDQLCPLEFIKQYERKSPFVAISNLGNLDQILSNDSALLELIDVDCLATVHGHYANKWCLYVLVYTFNSSIKCRFGYVKPYWSEKNIQFVFKKFSRTIEHL